MGIALSTFFAKRELNKVESRNIRIAKCNHCKQITKQCNNSTFLQKKDDWVCYNCGVYSHLNPCPCGHCETHPYEQTGLTEKDITK